MRFRQSHLKQFGDCAQQFYLFHLHDKPELVGSLTVLGSVWHFAVEVYESYGFDLDLGERTFVHYWERPEELGLTIDFWHRRTTYEGLQKRGLMMLRQYHDTRLWREGNLLGSEIHFTVPLGDHELEGTIDKLWIRPGRQLLEVLDFKTGARVPEKLRQNVQFTAYCYATMRPEFWQYVPGWEDGHHTFQGWKRGGAWYHARNNKLFNAGYRESKDYQKLHLAVIEMARAIDREVFPLTISGETCGYCPFVGEECGANVPNPAEV
jgi:hypothetical protein